MGHTATAVPTRCTLSGEEPTRGQIADMQYALSVNEAVEIDLRDCGFLDKPARESIIGAVKRKVAVRCLVREGSHPHTRLWTLSGAGRLPGLEMEVEE